MKLNEKNISKFFLILNIVVLIAMTFLAFNNSIWKDEVTDLTVIRDSYSSFLLQNRDAAPPLHFTVMKFLVDHFKMIFPNASTIILAKLTSVIPFVIIMILSMTVIAKKFGRLTASLFSFLCLLMPHMLGFSIEIRQYSWSILCMILWFLAFYSFIQKERWRDVVFCTILGGTATLFHYFSCIGIAVSYIIIFIYYCLDKRKSGIIKTLGLMIAPVLIVMPWLAKANVITILPGMIKIIGQQNFTVFDLLFYIFQTDTNKFGIGYVTGIIFWCIVITLFLLVRKMKMTKEILFVKIGLLIPAGIILLGIIVTLFVAPLIQPRYILPSMGCFWLAFSIAVTKLKDKRKLFAFILFFVFVTASLDAYKVMKDERQYAVAMEDVEVFLSTLEKDDILLSNDYRMIYCFTVYVDNENIWIKEDSAKGKIKLDSWIEEGRTIYYIDVTDWGIETDILEQANENNYHVENLGEYRLEYVTGDIYKIGKN